MIDTLMPALIFCHVICRSAYKLSEGYFMECDEQGSKADFFFLSNFLKC